MTGRPISRHGLAALTVQAPGESVQANRFCVSCHAPPWRLEEELFARCWDERVCPKLRAGQKETAGQTAWGRFAARSDRRSVSGGVGFPPGFAAAPPAR